MYSINSIGTSFDIDLKDFKQVLLKNQYPLHMIDNVIKKFFQNSIKTNTENVSVRHLILKQDILNFLSFQYILK